MHYSLHMICCKRLQSPGCSKVTLNFAASKGLTIAYVSLSNFTYIPRVAYIVYARSAVRKLHQIITRAVPYCYYLFAEARAPCRYGV